MLPSGERFFQSVNLPKSKLGFNIGSVRKVDTLNYVHFLCQMVFVPEQKPHGLIPESRDLTRGGKLVYFAISGSNFNKENETESKFLHMCSSIQGTQR